MQSFQSSSIDDTVKAIADRVDASLNFANVWLPFDCFDAKDLFYLLKSATKFKHDRPGVEQIQSFQTLMTDNIHGEPGAGDCDCLTVAAVACLHLLDYPTGIILQGNGKQPTHVLAFYDKLNSRRPFDLTEGFNQMRNYKYSQEIKMFF